ncbi:MAG: apolipoprotein N-acyltransferase [Chlorobium sp.]|nr:MAG: apolipoprotein N-acyltransferase [Chlorobium sp.]
MTFLSRTVNFLSNSRYAPSILSGVLLGLSFPSYPFIRLEVLAWVALVPLLLSLRFVEKPGDFFRRVYLSMLLFCLITLWWVSLATLPGGILTIVSQAFFMTVPLFAFFLLKRVAGYRFALFSFPFLWVAWEWSYMQQDLSLGWLTLGNSQANFNLMIQYADLLGVWGISFWLLWFNVFVLLALIGSRKDVVVSVTAMVLMIVAPLLYASVVFHRYASHPGEGAGLRVTLVQPNIDPYEKWEGYNNNTMMNKYSRLTGRAVRENRPELVIWPETAIPFYILDTMYAEELNSLRFSVRQWNTPLLTGFSDIVHYSSSLREEAGVGRKYDQLRKGSFETFNASMLLLPGNGVPRIYRKMHLVPFAERVPYVEYFPFLGNATFSLAGISSWGKGRECAVMELHSSRHGSVKLANIICYESIFPGFVTEFVRKGAQFLTLVTNDGWYSTSYGPYQHLAIGRMRCIENRRAMARCANTGLTVVIDKFGRTIAEIPWWQESSLTAEVPLESQMTFYTIHPDLLPKVSVAVTVLLFLLAFSMKFKWERER